METLAYWIAGVEGLLLLIGIVLIVYLIVRRIRTKKGEDFGGRTN